MVAGGRLLFCGHVRVPGVVAVVLLCFGLRFSELRWRAGFFFIFGISRRQTLRLSGCPAEHVLNIVSGAARSARPDVQRFRQPQLAPDGVSRNSGVRDFFFFFSAVPVPVILQKKYFGASPLVWVISYVSACARGALCIVRLGRQEKCRERLARQDLCCWHHLRCWSA